MKFLNWMGVTEDDLIGLTKQACRDLPVTLEFIGALIILALIVRSMPQ